MKPATGSDDAKRNSFSLAVVVQQILQPRNFLTTAKHTVRFSHEPPANVIWEVFRGHLLDRTQTRSERCLESWHVFMDEKNANSSATPLISLWWDEAANALFVTRNILIHTWEAFEPSPGVIDSRPATKWAPELIGRINLANRCDPAELHRELACYIDMACVGVSRLPITSVESPLPAFSLGELAFVSDELGGDEANRTLEFALRTADAFDADHTARLLLSDSWEGSYAIARLRQLFQRMSLTPYTRFPLHLTQLLRTLAAPRFVGVEPMLDLVGYMLRHLCRHLTAYDLTTFHSQGANYPDALWLDLLLRTFIDLLSDSSKTTSLQRRALRLAWLARQNCEGLRVPDAPTSLGENRRVWPDSVLRMSDEQILQPQLRQRRLFENEPTFQLVTPTAAALLKESATDLANLHELLELGTATFLDRPFGICKEPGAVDRTPLLAYRAFSRRLAGMRLLQLQTAGWLTADVTQQLQTRLADLPVSGFRAVDLPGSERPGVVALEDARRASDDFVFLSTTRGSLEIVRNFLDDQSQLLLRSDCGLLIRTANADAARHGEPFLTLFDRSMSPLCQFQLANPAFDTQFYDESFGVEFPNGGIARKRLNS